MVFHGVELGQKTVLGGASQRLKVLEGCLTLQPAGTEDLSPY